MQTSPEWQFTQWRSLSAWSIVSFTLHSVKNLITNGYALIPLIYTGWKTGFSSPWIYVAAVTTVFAIVMFATIQWLKYRYRLQHDKLEITQGLLFKRHDEIPLDRVQNVRLDQALYFRPMSLCTLVVETAGSKKDEAQLTAVDFTLAVNLKQQLLRMTASAPAPATSAGPSDMAQLADDVSLTSAQQSLTPEENAVHSQPQPLLSRNLKDLLLFGFYQNNLVWVAIALSPIIGQFDWSHAADYQSVQSGIRWFQTHSNDNVFIQGAFLAVLSGIILSVLALLSMLSAVLKFYPYRLSLYRSTLQRSGGVLAHQQDALALERVQLVHFSQPALARVLKRWTLYFKQVQGNEIEERTKQHMLVPSISDNDITQLMPKLNRLAGSAYSLPTHFQRINAAWLRRRIFIPLIPPLLMTAIVGIDAYTELAWIIALLACTAIFLRYRQWGYYFGAPLQAPNSGASPETAALDTTDLDAADLNTDVLGAEVVHTGDKNAQGDESASQVIWQHTGFIGQSWKRIALEKVQHVKLVQTPSQKRNGLANLELGLASGLVHLPYIPLSDAISISELALAMVNRNTQNWI